MFRRSRTSIRPSRKSAKRARWLAAVRSAAAISILFLVVACATQETLIPETPLLSHPLSLRPGDDDAAKAIARLEIKEDWKGLAELAAQELKRRPSDEDWQFVLGYARMKAGDYPHAIESLQWVADRVPEDSDSRNLLGESLRLSGQVGRAIQVLERSVQAHPNSYQGWLMLGDAYFDDSRLERAKDAYRQSVQIQPDYATGWYGLARVLARVGPKDEYDLALQKLQELRPEIAKPAAAAPRP